MTTQERLMQRENRQIRRIWTAIARKQELFDDKEFRDVFDDEDQPPLICSQKLMSQGAPIVQLSQ